MTSIDKHFQEYFASMDAAGDDRCYLCRRTPSDVKSFFGFKEDGTPVNADEYGIEDVVLYKLDIMSYKGTRPICAVCQLNFETIFMAGDHELVQRVMREIEDERERLCPAEERGETGGSSAPAE